MDTPLEQKDYTVPFMDLRLHLMNAGIPYGEVMKLSCGTVIGMCAALVRSRDVPLTMEKLTLCKLGLDSHEGGDWDDKPYDSIASQLNLLGARPGQYYSTISNSLGNAQNAASNSTYNNAQANQSSQGTTSSHSGDALKYMASIFGGKK